MCMVRGKIPKGRWFWLSKIGILNIMSINYEVSVLPLLNKVAAEHNSAQYVPFNNNRLPQRWSSSYIFAVKAKNQWETVVNVFKYVRRKKKSMKSKLRKHASVQSLMFCLLWVVSAGNLFMLQGETMPSVCLELCRQENPFNYTDFLFHPVKTLGPIHWHC